MSSSKFLDIEPRELQFPFEMRKKVSCSLQLYNKTKDYVVFKFQQVRKTTPDKYFAKPNKGVMLPGSTCHVIITMQAQQDAPPNMWCEDKLFVKSITMHQADPGSASKDTMGIMIDMLMKEFSDQVDLVMLNVVYVRQAQPSCQVSDGNHKWDSASDNASAIGFITRSRQTAELQVKYSGVSSSLLGNKSSLNTKDGETKENAMMVSSDEDSDESDEYFFEAYSDECYEIDPTIFTHKLTFDDMADVSLVAEKGPVALRDFAHPRHLCGCFPFETTSHEIFCKKCFCCFCEVPCPCSQWTGINGHCHLSKKIPAGV